MTGPRESEEVVGSGCYFLSPTTNLAEIAFMIAPEWQGAGLGTALQARLQEYAIRRGVRGFVAEILPRNTSMLRLATRAPGTVTISRDEDAVHVTTIFAAPAPNEEAAPASPAPEDRLSNLDLAGVIPSANPGSPASAREDPAAL